ncbi:hypothetical protein Nepgr_034008 [Nepenthes gracilis]|uniref:Uncharacterized protein n=1 Tax=Nepenthes gracilis TaxID=150966 RepID=A0AAD3TMY3_NEPGR|nr:hypothetical protein Nepgr_034008 [Nepenthes gracilis]
MSPLVNDDPSLQVYNAWPAPRNGRSLKARALLWPRTVGLPSPNGSLLTVLEVSPCFGCLLSRITAANSSSFGTSPSGRRVFWNVVDFHGVDRACARFVLRRRETLGRRGEGCKVGKVALPHAKILDPLSSALSSETATWGRMYPISWILVGNSTDRQSFSKE